jgi:hypothetical protein
VFDIDETLVLAQEEPFPDDPNLDTAVLKMNFIPGGNSNTVGQ